MIKIVLCANPDPNESKRCRVGLEPLGSFDEIEPSTYDHISAKIATSDCKYRSCTTDFCGAKSKLSIQYG